MPFPPILCLIGFPFLPRERFQTISISLLGISFPSFFSNSKENVSSCVIINRQPRCITRIEKSNFQLNNIISRIVFFFFFFFTKPPPQLSIHLQHPRNPPPLILTSPFIQKQRKYLLLFPFIPSLLRKHLHATTSTSEESESRKLSPRKGNFKGASSQKFVSITAIDKPPIVDYSSSSSSPTPILEQVALYSSSPRLNKFRCSGIADPLSGNSPLLSSPLSARAIKPRFFHARGGDIRVAGALATELARRIPPRLSSSLSLFPSLTNDHFQRRDSIWGEEGWNQLYSQRESGWPPPLCGPGAKSRTVSSYFSNRYYPPAFNNPF